MIDVCLLGTGGMMPLPDRFLTSLYVRYSGKVILIDCGEGTQTAIRTAGLRFKPIDTVLLTHYHADHVSGLVGLLLTLGNEDRDEPLHIYGPAGLKKVIGALKVIVPELPYELVLTELSAGESFVRAGLTVEAIGANHGMPCLSYALTLDRPGKFDPEKARNNGVPLPLWGKLQSGMSLEGYCPEDVLGPARRGLKLLYSTDTLPLEAVVDRGKDADLLVLEGMFGGTEKDERAALTHHSTMNQSALLAQRAGARELWLTHYSPATPHPEEFEEEVKQVFPNTVISVDGQKKTLKFDE